MTVNTSNYLNSHGHRPKPSQDGAWAFLIERRDGSCTQFRATGTYRDALRSAKAEAKMIGGATAIHVGS